jgi:hypothetical protein
MWRAQVHRDGDDDDDETALQDFFIDHGNCSMFSDVENL